jgi:alkaline phosphatase
MKRLRQLFDRRVGPRDGVVVAASPTPARRGFPALAAIVAWVLALAMTTAGCAQQGPLAATPNTPRNVVIMFADGAAATQWNFGDYTSGLLRKQPFATTQTVLRSGTLGALSTSSSDSYVTDSAAAASAMSTGHKVNNGAISMSPDGKPLRTLMQAARQAGKRIGLVTTATVYDATPAAFSINVKSRRDSQAVVDAYATLKPEVLLGGGANYFLPENGGGKRKDARDVIAEFRAAGYEIARDTSQLKAARGPKVLGLFASEDLDFEIDRNAAEQPSTADMAQAALDALSRSSPNGFVLLVENENTDTAAHANDASSLMRALWAFDDAVKVALDFQVRNPGTLVLVTGDHETGGFSATSAFKDLSSASSGNRFTAGPEQVQMLGRITKSFAAMKTVLGAQPSGPVLDDLLRKHFPGFRLDADLRHQILTLKAGERNFSHAPESALGAMVARQTGFYWGTSGHTPQPVLVGAIGPGAERFAGYQDNTDFARHLHRLIGVAP